MRVEMLENRTLLSSAALLALTNDSFSMRSALSADAAPISGSTQAATAEDGEPNHAGLPAAQSRWYEWAASTDGRVLLRTGAQGDLAIGVYTGADIADLTEVASNYRTSWDPILDEQYEAWPKQISFQATAGMTYYIAVDGADVAYSLSLQTTGLVPNDDLADAAVLTGDDVSANESLLLATQEDGEPSEISLDMGSTWYSWEAPQDGSYVVQVRTASGEATYTVATYSGDAIGALIPVGSWSYSFAHSILDVSAGERVIIHVAADEGSAGEYRLTIAPLVAPTNDDFANAADASIGSVSATNIGATAEEGEPDHSQNLDGAASSVWWKWTAAADGPVTIDTMGSDFDTVLAVYSGTDLQNLTLEAAGDDTAETIQSSVTFDAVAGTTYYIAVDGFQGEQGSVVLNIDAAAPVPLVARDDWKDTEGNLQVTLSPLDNDTGDEGMPVSISSLSQPQHGTAELNDDGTISYRPTIGYTGSDALTYTVTDGVTSATATIRLRVSIPSVPIIGVLGGLGADTISISSPANDVLTWNVNGRVRQFRLSALQGILIRGYAGADTILVDGAITIPVTVDGGLGDDTITGGAGNDVLMGGRNRDLIHGGAGNDSIHGGGEDDSLFGDSGNDYISGLGGSDLLDGGDGNDVLYSGDGNDLLRGGNGDDALHGGNGSDRLYGDDGRDSLSGEDGLDMLYAKGGGVDIVSGGEGDDIAWLDASDIVRSVERLRL